MDTSGLADLADLALVEVSRLGVDYADARARHEDSESVQVRDESVEGVSRESSRGVGIRVLYDGAWGFAGTSDPSPDAVRRAAQQAVEVARASARVRGRDGHRAELDDTPPSVGSYTTPHERDLLEVPLAEKVDHLLAATAAARAAAPIAYAEASTDAWRTATSYRDSHGGRIDQVVLQVGGGMAAFAIGGSEFQQRSHPNSFGGQYETGGWERVVMLDLAGGAPAAAREAVALLDAPDLPLRENATLVLESSQLALQVHESVGHAVELDRILGSEAAYAGTSWVAANDRGALRYGSPLMTVVADATTPSAMGTFGYDDEGVPAGSAPSGWAEAGATAISALDAAALGRRVQDKITLGASPIELPAGRYPVVLESHATNNLVQWLARLALSGRAYNEGRSAVSGRLGEQVCSPLVTIVDDPLSPLLPGLAFDPEGTPTRRTPLIDRGIAVGVTHDRATGAAAGTGSTGHALPAPNPHGGIATHLLMEPGDASLTDLVAGLERGLYVTRFHYTNVVHPVTTSITGMTRDGTFVVEDGRIVGGVRNLRFTQSCLDALSGCEAVGRDVELTTALFYGSSGAPAVRLSGFTFTSTTTY